jgi:hypothetical protein
MRHYATPPTTRKSMLRRLSKVTNHGRMGQYSTTETVRLNRASFPSVDRVFPQLTFPSPLDRHLFLTPFLRWSTAAPNGRQLWYL